MAHKLIKRGNLYGIQDTDTKKTIALWVVGRKFNYNQAVYYGTYSTYVTAAIATKDVRAIIWTPPVLITSFTSETTSGVVDSEPLNVDNQYSNSNVGYYIDSDDLTNVFVFPTGGQSETTLKMDYMDGYGMDRTITLTYDSAGYYSSGAVQLDYQVTSGYTNFKIYEDGVTPIEPTYQNNVSNTTYVGTKDSDTGVTVTLTADEGYKIDAASLGYTNTDGEASTANMQISSDYSTATCSITDADLENTIYINGTASPKAVTPTFTNNVAHSTLSYSGSDHQYVVTITADSGYYIDGNIEASYTGYSSDNPVSVTLATATDLLSAKGVLPDVDENNVITVSGKTGVQITINTELSNCSVSSVLPSWYKHGETITITLQANENCIFADGSTNNVNWQTDEGYPVSNPFTISEDKTTASITVTLPTEYSISWVRIVGNATPSKIVGSKYGAINVYKVTLDNLEEFSKVRFFKENRGSDDNPDYELINLGEYVNRIKRIFVDVPTASTDVIKCGNYNTGVSVYAPDADVITLDFGSVTIPSINGDSTDYESEINVFLPFKGFVSIPVDYIGKDISLTYEVNIITGDGVAKLKCGDDLIQVQDVEPSADVLYKTASEIVTQIGGERWNESLYYGLEPFVRVKYYNSLNKTARNNDYENAKLGDLSGFCKVDDVLLSTSQDMTIREEETILQTLKDGVYL